MEMSKEQEISNAGTKDPIIPSSTSPPELAAIPIKWWATFGALFLIFQLWIWVRFLISHDCAPIPPPAQLSDADQMRLTLIRILEIISPIVGLWVAYRWALKPLWRQGHIPSDGLLLLTMPLIFFHDNLTFWFSPWIAWSSLFTNVGSWSGSIPGAISPTGHITPSPWLFGPLGYIWGLGLPMLGIAWLMRWWKRRFPKTSNPGIFFVGIGAGFLYDLILDPTGIALQLWAFPGAIQSISVFGGKWYQFPINELLCWGTVEGLGANLLYWTNGKGQTIVERGIERLKVSRLRLQVVRFLAMLCATHLIFLCCYSIPNGILSLNGDFPPPDMPAHLMNRVCGPGTDIICTGKGVPIMKGRTGFFITPDYQLIRK
jgi:hypothetical protein